MAIQKYDIPIRGTSKFELKCWKAENIPLLTDEEELQLIVHAVVDVTEDVLSNKKIEEFIMQDAAQLLSKDPKVYKALKAVTDLGGLADVVIHGRGFTDEFKKFFSDLIELFTPSTKQTNSQADDIRRNKIDKTRNDFGTMAYNLIKKKSI